MNQGLESISFRDCIYSQNSLYFFSSLYSFPMKKNLITGEMEVLPIHTKENQWDKTIDLEISLGRNIYVLDMKGQHIIKYNMDTYEASYYEIDCPHSPDGNFAYMAEIDNNIYVFTREARKLVIFDTNAEATKEISYPDIVKDNIYICGCKVGETFFVFPRDGNQVLEYETSGKVWRVHRLNESLRRCVHAAMAEDNIYILLADGTVFEWNIRSENIIKMEYNLPIYTNQNTASRICCTKNSFVVLPALAQDIIRINRDTYKADIYKDYPEDFSYDPARKLWTKYYGYCENDTEYYFACRTSGHILKIEKQSGNISWIKSEVDKWEIEKAALENKSVISEKERYLQWFIAKSNKKKEDRKTPNIGEEIWGAMQR